MSAYLILESSGDVAVDKGDSFVKSIIDAFPALVRPATSIEHLFHVLKDLPPPVAGQKRIIQVVGHGSPGRLSVGDTFDSGVSAGTDHHFLDSDPYVYGILEHLLQPADELWIIGCSVGEDPPPPKALVATGPVLVFDLSQMWGCTVKASTGIVHVSDFDPTGTFKDASRLVTSQPEAHSVTLGGHLVPLSPSWNVTPQPHVTAPQGASTTKALKLLRVLDAPSRVNTSSPFQPYILSSSASDRITGSYPNLLAPGLGQVGAIPEFVFDASLDGAFGRAEVLLNGRVLRFRGADGSVFDFVKGTGVPDGLLPSAHKELYSLLRPPSPMI